MRLISGGSFIRMAPIAMRKRSELAATDQSRDALLHGEGSGRKIGVENREIQCRARGELHDAFPHLAILPASGAETAVDLDARVLADEHILLKGGNALIVLPFAAAIDLFRRGGKDLDEQRRIP
jgi:hypothetical protein